MEQRHDKEHYFPKIKIYIYIRITSNDLFMLLRTYKIAIHTSRIMLRKLGRCRSSVKHFIERYVESICSSIERGRIRVWVLNRRFDAIFHGI
jgi:hypothetical protein